MCIRDRLELSLLELEELSEPPLEEELSPEEEAELPLEDDDELELDDDDLELEDDDELELDDELTDDIATREPPPLDDEALTEGDEGLATATDVLTRTTGAFSSTPPNDSLALS